MSARRIAREIVVILLPQLPRDKTHLSKLEINTLICKSVQILVSHAKQCLVDVQAYLLKAQKELVNIEMEHPDNRNKIQDIRPVNLNTGELRHQVETLDTAVRLISESLDIPEMALASQQSQIPISCPSCANDFTYNLSRPFWQDVHQFIFTLVETYLSHKKEIDELIRDIKTKWRIERMVSVDRDIIRLAVTETFYLTDIPINVAVSEAIELAHRFADPKAAKFINGVLGDLAKQAQHYRETGELNLDLIKISSDEAAVT